MMKIALISLFLFIPLINATSPNCTGTVVLNLDFIVDWTVQGTVVSFVVLASSGAPDSWAALGFTTQTSTPFMVQLIVTICTFFNIS